MFIHTKRKENKVQIRVSNRGDKRRTWLISCRLKDYRPWLLHQAISGKKEKGNLQLEGGCGKMRGGERLKKGCVCIGQ
jgi:hypothetical protein